MSRGIRPSRTKSTAALWAKSLLNAVLFFVLFMVILPLTARWALPQPVPVPFWLGTAGGGALCAGGIAVWGYCLDVFSRRGRGTPFPLDAPRHLVTSGPFAVVRNPIMAAELAVIWGEALCLSAWGGFVYAAAATLTGHLVVVYVEEPELHERFAEEYEAYCRAVSRWLPRAARRRRVLDRNG